MYQRGERTMYGQHFPDRLSKNDPLPAPVLTPTTKAVRGAHDAPLTPDGIVPMGLIDAEIWRQMQDAAFAIFRRGQEIAARHGLILVDTKYEFGLDSDGKLILIDEVHTPDSSRYWRASSYAAQLAARQEPEILDKEYIRLWYAEHNYRGEGEPPALPETMIIEASYRYIQVYEGLADQKFDPAPYPAEARILAALRGAKLLS
jgi:phosphoribosylaminoimidazole-succinocarboxamide synthase